MLTLLFNNMIMKRFFLIALAVLTLTSCLETGSGMGQKYSLIASFQYSGISFKSDSTFVNAKDTIGFSFDVLNFYHTLNYDLSRLEGGFLLSGAEMPKSGDVSRLMKTYRAFVPASLSSGNIYTVFYQNPDNSKMPAHDVSFPYTVNGTCTMGGCYLTNTVEVAEYVKANFTLGDRLTVKATGYLNGQKTGETEMALADFSAQKDSIVSTWTPFELVKLGSVEYVDFEIISSRPGVPPYFCMDSMVAEINLEY